MLGSEECSGRLKNVALLVVGESVSINGNWVLPASGRGSPFYSHSAWLPMSPDDDDDQSQDLAADCTLGLILVAVIGAAYGSTASDCHLDVQVCSTSVRCWSHRVVACIGSPSSCNIP